MKLVSCHIENFGKFSDFSFEFSDYNVIYQPNGWGKTTLCYFIKSMLFGFVESRSKDLSINERRRYTPFTNGKFGGNLIIEENNKRYRIERFFGENSNKDTFALYELPSNKLSKDYSACIGEEITGLNGEAFSKCLCLPQQKSIVQADDSLSAKLSNLLEDEKDINNYENAQKLLDKKRKEYVKMGAKTGAEKGSRGIIEACENAIDIKRREISSVGENSELYTKSKEELRAATEEMTALQERISDITSKLKRLSAEKDDYYLYKEYENLANNHKEKQAQYDTIISQLNGTLYTSENIEKYRKTEEETVGLKAQISLLSEQQKNAPKPVKKSSKAAFIVFLILSVLSLAGGLYTHFNQFDIYVYFACYGFSALALIIGIITLFIKKKPKSNLPDYSAQIEELTARFDKSQATLNQLYNAAAVKSVAELESKCNEAEKLRKQIDDLYGKMQLFAQNNDLPQKCPNYDEQKVNQLTEEKENCNTKLLALSSKVGSLQVGIAQLKEKCDSLPVLRSELDTLLQRKAEYESNLKIITLTKTYLENARNGLNSAYMPRLVEYFNKYMAMSGNKDLKFTIDSDLTVSFVSAGETKNRGHLSAGYSDLADICVRLALADCMFENKHFLLLDDPFTDLDDEKIKHGLKMMKNLAKTRQIIYTSCNSSRV